jgi:3-dehydroquinate synthetase
LRGVPLIQIPASLLAMVDSSIGGKTGINHRTGKNLIGAFYQPPIVVIDPELLRTLPKRELTASWAEIVKHAEIQPSSPGGERADLLAFLERNGNRLRRLESPATTYAIERNVRLKAAVVEADERETGIRAYLNFGHTLGHAIEASDYRLLHGEAISVGMRAAMRIGLRMEMIGPGDVTRLDALLDAFELPATASSDRETVLAKMGSDKKRVDGRQRWVLPLAEGGVTLRSDIPEFVVLDALREVTL